MSPRTILFALICVMLNGICASAQPLPGIKILKIAYPDGAIVSRLSDNGKWAVAQVGMSEAIKDASPRIINVDTQEDTPLTIGAVACDISDDGNIVVGNYQGCPAWWNNSEGEWHSISVPEPYNEGTFAAITPDGRYAVGTFSNLMDYTERPILFDINKQVEITLDNLPQVGMTNEPVTQNRFIDISPDGRYILGTVQYSYPSPPELFSYVYDRETSAYHIIGFDENPGGDWTPLAKDLFFTDEPAMSPNGKWVCGKAYICHKDGFSDFATEYYTAFRYNIQAHELEVYDEAIEDAGNPAFCIADSGELLGATPMTSPLRNWNVRHGAYWYPFAQIWRQQYSGDFSSTGYDQTGTPVSVSGDGRRIACIVDPQGESYIAILPDNIREAATGVRLIANYIPIPETGSAFETLGELEILFDRDIQALSAPSAVTLVDTDGNIVRHALYFSPDESLKSKIIIGFRPQHLDAGKTYTVVIPAGAVALAGDKAQTNDEIRLEYKGRAAGPIALTSFYPADYSVVTKIDAAESPILLEFETNVLVAKNASAQLVHDGGDEDGYLVTPLYFTAQKNHVGLFPPSVIYLYDGEKYRVEVAAGSLTDVRGEGGSANFDLHLIGNYVREISQNDETIFADDFSNIAASLNTYMLYDGDGNAPSAMMKEMEFTATTTAWNFSLRESMENSDIFAGSHSMYATPGQSDDWMVLPGLNLPDQWCTLEFDTQSYDPAKNDRLRVVALPCDDVVNFADHTFINKMETQGTVLFDEVVSAGDSKDRQADEWTHVRLSLADFGGKMIYLAFVNQNRDESMVFIDNIKVKRNLKYLIEVTSPESVAALDEQRIAGKLVANSDNEQIAAVSLTLKDEKGEVVSTFARQNLGMTKGQSLSFAFESPLQLSLGDVTTYSIEPTITMSDGKIYDTRLDGRVKNLAHATKPHVVVEEMTGLDCGNCPLGILALEHLEHLYPGSIYPVSIHTYTGDPYASGLEGYTAFLGIMGAPTGMVNRNGKVISPIGNNNSFYGDDVNPTWADLARQAMTTMPEADIDAQISLDRSAGTLDIDLEVLSALNLSNVNYNVFAVVLEDEVRAYQHNYFAEQTGNLFGEWGAGGIYGKEYVRPYIHRDVARQFIGYSYAGTAGLLPQTMEAGKTYTARLSDYIPQNLAVRDDGRDPLDYLKAVVVLLNANTGRIVNATCVPLTLNNVGIDTIAADKKAPHGVSSTWYGIDGRRLAKPQGGFCIERTTMSDGSVRSRKVLR